MTRHKRLVPRTEVHQQILGLKEAALGGLLLTAEDVDYAESVPPADLGRPLRALEGRLEVLQRQARVVEILHPGELGRGEPCNRMGAVDLAYPVAGCRLPSSAGILHRRLEHPLVSKYLRRVELDPVCVVVQRVGELAGLRGSPGVLEPLTGLVRLRFKGRRAVAVLVALPAGGFLFSESKCHVSLPPPKAGPT